MTEKEYKQYWKEAGLVILGAILASVPILISAHIQQKTQLQQFMLERKITALRDYSMSYNRLAVDVLPKIEKLERTLKDYEDEFLEKQELTDKRAAQLKLESDVVNEYFNAWSAQVNSQAIIVNLLFNADIPKMFFTFDQFVENDNTSDTPPEREIKQIREGYSKFKGGLIEMLEGEQIRIRQLASTIQQ